MISGYLRPDGQVGIRNHLLILSSVVCANSVVEGVANAVPGAIPITHQHGCAQIGDDRQQVLNTLVGLGKNPNVGAVIVVGLGCENIPAEEIYEAMAPSGKPASCVSIQQFGGTIKTTAKGVEIARNFICELSKMKREPFGLDKLIVGTECGGSDATSGLASNPVTGYVADKLIEQGATVLLSETTEFIGAEHLLAVRAQNTAVAEDLFQRIAKIEKEVERWGCDIRGAQPSPGNMRGGLTTIEEKSLGCICKGGTSPINEIVSYAQKPEHKGLVIMDTPGHDVESITGMVAGGAQLVIFTTGRGTPVGCPIAPVLKITGNPETYENMVDNIDINAGRVITGEATLEDVGEECFDELISLANGKLSKAEALGNREFAISRITISM